MVKLTREFIHRYKSGSGGWNRAQVEALGLSWPPQKGWISRLEGVEITEAQAEKFKTSKKPETMELF